MIRLTPIILILMASGLLFVGSDPTFKKLQAIQVDASRYANVLDQAKQLERIRDNLLNEYNTIDEASREKLKKLLPDEVDTVRLVMDINDIARQHSLIVRGLNLATDNKAKKNTPAGELQEIGFGFGVEASYDEFISFMKALERSLRIIDVVSINITAGKDDRYNFAVNAKIYWMK